MKTLCCNCDKTARHERLVEGLLVPLCDDDAARMPVMTILVEGEQRPVTNFYSASCLFRQYIEAEGLGASDLGPRCGEIRQGADVVAHVSYNGRVWSGPVGKPGLEIFSLLGG